MPSLLAIIPHPDDESYSFSGTIARAAQRGWACRVVSASSGERGRRHDGGPEGREALGLAREAELAASCAAIGAEPPGFFRFPDGGLSLVDGPAHLGPLLDQFAPDLILALGADGAYGHPDHIAVFRWVTAAWRSLGDSRPVLLYRAFAKGLLLPQYEKCIGMMGEPPQPPAWAIGSDSEEVHYRVQVADLAPLRLDSIRAHRSQLPNGDPYALFPEPVVRRILEDDEYFLDATGNPDPATFKLLEGIVSATREN